MMRRTPPFCILFFSLLAPHNKKNNKNKYFIPYKVSFYFMRALCSNKIKYIKKIDTLFYALNFFSVCGSV